MPILTFKNGKWCELTLEEIEEEKKLAAQKRQADEEARMERQQELSKQYGADIWNAAKGADCWESFFDDAGPKTLYADISDGLMDCTWEDYGNNAYKRIDLSYIDTLAVRRLLNCEDNAALFEEMKKRFGSEDGINQIDSWLTENELYFKREEE